jgi:hypothetical protein
MAQLDKTLSKRLLRGVLPPRLTLPQAWLLESLSLATAMQDGPVTIPKDLEPLFLELRLATMPTPSQVM